MPVATEFESEGVDNGFPSCLTGVDVSATGDDYEYWTTLSGWSKVNAPASDADKAKSISDSLILASKWYWNTYKVNFTSSLSGPSGSGTITEVNSEDNGDINFGTPAVLTPVSRACGGFPRMYKTDPADADPFGDNYLYASASMYNIIRMYDGPKTDEANFIGHGFSIDNIYISDDFFFGAVAVVGFSDAEYGPGNIDYCTVPMTVGSDVFHAVCLAFGDTSDPANMSAEWSFMGDSLSLQIDSVELYTYPA